MASTFEFARRAQNRGAAELATILAGPPPGALSMSGGFPNPETFPTADLDEIVARLLRDEPGVALQYAPSEGIPSVREYLIDRQEHLQGRRPEPAELTVTSGGMECIALLCQALLDPGDSVAVEAPDLPRRADGVRAGRGRRDRDRDGRRRARRRGARGAARGGRAPEAPVRDPGVPEPVGVDAGARAARAADRAVPPPRRADRRGRRLPRDGVRHGHRAAVAVVARARHRAPGRHVLEDLLPRRAARVGGRAARGRRADRGREAADRPVRGRARAADGRGVRPRRPLRPPAPAGPRALRRALARAVDGAASASSAASARGASRPAASSPG